MLNDVVLNIRTMPPSTAAGTEFDSGKPTGHGHFSRAPKHNDNMGYDPPEYWYIRAVTRRLKLAPEDVFYDVGCGMGRVICVVARRRVRKCVGIELLEPLCQKARRNSLRLRGRKSPIEIIWADAATADLSAGTIYYLYHPFGKDTMRDFLSNLETSILREPRKVTLVYYNSVHESILKTAGWLTKSFEFNTYSGQHVSFWKSCAAAGLPEGTSPK